MLPYPAVLHLGGHHYLHVVHPPGAWQGFAPINHQTIQQMTAALNVLLGYVEDSDVGADPSSYPGVLLCCLHHLLATNHLLPHPPLAPPPTPSTDPFPGDVAKKSQVILRSLDTAGGRSWGELEKELNYCLNEEG